MKVTIGLAVILSLFDQQVQGIKQADPFTMKDDYITTAQLDQGKSKKLKKHKVKASKLASTKDESHDSHLAGLHLGDFQPSDVKASKDDTNLSKKTKQETSKSKQTKKAAVYKKKVPMDDQEKDESNEPESVDAHMAGFHKHIVAADPFPTANLENEIMGAVKMTDYDELTKTYVKANKKDINENVVKDKYQDSIPMEDQDQKKEIKTGEHADHYEDHGESKEVNDAAEPVPKVQEEKDQLPHGTHADHYEEHGESKEVDSAAEPQPQKESDLIPHGGHADHYDDEGLKKKPAKKQKKKHHKKKWQTKVVNEIKEEIIGDKPEAIIPEKEEQQKPLVDQLDIKKTKDKEDFDAQKKKMKIEQLPKPVPLQEDPNKPAEEKQPLEAKVINSGWSPNKDKPKQQPEEQAKNQQQSRTKAHQHKSKSKSKSKKHHHKHHAQKKHRTIVQEVKEEQQVNQTTTLNKIEELKPVNTTQAAAPVSTTIVPLSNSTQQPNMNQPIQIVIQQQGIVGNSTSNATSSQVQQPTIQTQNGGQQIIVSIPMQQQAAPKVVPALTPLSELAQQKTKAPVLISNVQSEQQLEDDPYLHAESLSSSDQDAYPGLAVIYQKQETIDSYMKA